MSNESPLKLVQKALKLINDIEDDNKGQGLVLLRSILETNNEQLVAFGYDQVIFKELVKMLQSETKTYLKVVLELLGSRCFGNEQYSDELVEQLIYRVARSTDADTSKLCLVKIFSLVDTLDESIAKHSKQLLKLADLNENSDLNEVLSSILIKLKDKLPRRRLEVV